jgi:hypothetical protein
MSIQTVGDLKKLLADVPDNTPVIGHMSDHTYFPAQLVFATALYEGHGSWCQDYGQKCTPEPAYGKRMSVLIVE